MTRNEQAVLFLPLICNKMKKTNMETLFRWRSVKNRQQNA
jgi:hypothetical protein